MVLGGLAEFWPRLLVDGDSPGLFPRRIDGRNHHAHEDANDGDYDQ